MSVDFIGYGDVPGGDVAFLVYKDVAAQLKKRATLCFECKNFFKSVCKQDGVRAHVSATIDEILGFVRKLTGPVDQVFLWDAHVVHLATSGVIVVHQKTNVRCGDY